MAETRIFPDKNLVSTSSLENLPKELHSLIFQALPDCASLQALVQASPSYHASYISQRQHILSRVLLNELGLDGLYLAFALEQVCILPWLQRDYEEQLHLFHQSFFGHFFKRFLDSATTDWTPDTDLDTLTWICRRHWLIRSVALEYIADKIKVNPLTGNVVRNGQPATAEECRRKYRALYHFEIYRCLFVSYTLTGDTEDAYYYQQRVQLGGWEYGTSMRYLPNIDVCDAEGVACVRKFLSSQYMKRMTTDCREELQRLEDHPPDWNPISKVDVDSSEETNFRGWTMSYEEEKIDYWMSLGLGFFKRVSRAPTVEDKAQILYQNPWRRTQFISKAVNAECFGLRRRWQCSAHGMDYDHTTESNEGFRVGKWWKTSGRGLVGYDRETLQDWGYIFWDQSRLDAWKMEAEASRPASKSNSSE